VAAAATITLPDAIDRALHYAPAVDVASATTDMSAAHVTEQRALDRVGKSNRRGRRHRSPNRSHGSKYDRR